MIREAVILAGGLGTRLRSVVSDLPKPMAPVNGRPFLDYQLAYLAFFGVKKVILAVGYLHEKIIQHYGDHFGNLSIEYSIEHEPLGTGGALKLALEKTTVNPILVTNGDTFFELELSKFRDFYRMRDARLTIALREVDDTSRYGKITIDWDGRITEFSEKSEEGGPGFINGGIYLLDKNFFSSFQLPDKFSLERDFLQQIYKTHPIYGMICRKYFVDIGVPEEYERTREDFSYFRYF